MAKSIIELTEQKVSLEAQLKSQLKVPTEEIAKMIFTMNNRDYCRACKPCEKPPCQRMKDLAKSIVVLWDKK